MEGNLISRVWKLLHTEGKTDLKGMKNYHRLEGKADNNGIYIAPSQLDPLF